MEDKAIGGVESKKNGKTRSEIITSMITDMTKNHGRDWRVTVNQVLISLEKDRAAWA